ncbi:Suf-domain-containing protein [Mycena galericulata]|nr:Suf-domain-containing protein [Mycena galericulata]
MACEYDALTSRLQKSPHDPRSWISLVDITESSGDTSRICQTYEALLKQYPSTTAAQIAYVHHFLHDPTTFGEAERLFRAFLPTSPSVTLWTIYLSHVQRMNQGPTAYQTVCEAFDCALEHVGQDSKSGSIWAGYIQFCHAAETTTPSEIQQKVEGLRKLYHRAIRIPLDNLDKLWIDYKAFERGLKEMTNSEYLQDLAPAYIRARTVLHQLSVHLEKLGSLDTTKLVLPTLPTFSPEERAYVGCWKAYIKWEEGNPLEIPGNDLATLNSRMQMVYRKATIHMRYYPEIWQVPPPPLSSTTYRDGRFMAFSWASSIGKESEALCILKAGLAANPDSFVLNYSYAELLEKVNLKKQQGDYSEVHSVYSSFLGVLRANLARLSVTAIARDELVVYEKQYSNAWINYMRFARRAQGQQACRRVFKMARLDEYIRWEVYAAAALTEYRCNMEDGRTIASRILESGMKKFGTDATYVLCHLDFLLMINDENNARALFERVISTFTPLEAKPIWERWSRCEYQYDNLEAALELQRRMAEVYPSDAPIKFFARRHTYQSFDAIADHDLGVAKVRKLGATGHLRPSGSLQDNINGRSSPTALNGTKRTSPSADLKPETNYKRPRLDHQVDRWQPQPRRDPLRQGRPAALPDVLHRFIEQLPPAKEFAGGPPGLVFESSYLMHDLRTEF